MAELRVSLGGLGAIGSEIARRVAAGLPGVRLTAVSARDTARAARVLTQLGLTGVSVVALPELPAHADVVVECVPREAFEQIAIPALQAGRELIVLSAGALLDHPELIELARQTGARITVPTGALVGLDAVGAAALERIDSLRIVSRKPVAALAGAPEIERQGLKLDELEVPVRVFAGTAREAARGFPANLNVAVALALAGPGPDRTHVEVWVDPSLSRNTHRIELRSPVADMTMTIENVPSENPRTGRITALSVVNLLRKRGSPVSVGS